MGMLVDCMLMYMYVYNGDVGRLYANVHVHVHVALSRQPICTTLLYIYSHVPCISVHEQNITFMWKAMSSSAAAAVIYDLTLEQCNHSNAIVSLSLVKNDIVPWAFAASLWSVLVLLHKTLLNCPRWNAQQFKANYAIDFFYFRSRLLPSLFELHM